MLRSDEDGEVRFKAAKAAAWMSDSTIMAIAEHVSRRMLERYSHVRTEAKRKAVDSFSKGTGWGMTQTLTQMIGE